jgi:hypothetical protein
MLYIHRARALVITLPFTLTLAGCGDMPAPNVFPEPTARVGFSDGPALTMHRHQHASTVLANGRVLVCGGVNKEAMGTYDNGTPWNAHSAWKSCESFDPTTETFEQVKSMEWERRAHQLTLLPDGKVLASGGQHEPNFPWPTEIYDPKMNEWETIGPMEPGRVNFTATFRPGEALVLAAGGIHDSDIVDSMFFLVTDKKWQKADAMQVSRCEHGTALLPDPDLSILVAGGRAAKSAVLDSAELFNAAREWTTTAILHGKRRLHTLTAFPKGVTKLFPNGGAIAVGGADEDGNALRSVEIFDAKLRQWTIVTDMPEERSEHGAILINNGKRLLVTGGVTKGGRILSNAAVLDLETNQWTTHEMKNARNAPTVELLLDGRVLVIGGIADGIFLQSTEIFTPPCASHFECAPGFRCGTDRVCVVDDI